MPRKARLDAPGALHHIMVRGINKSEIFKDDQDKSLFLKRLGTNVLNSKASVYAWALMNNHAHILLKSGQGGISGIMRKLLTWYSQYYNRRHERSGHLFENRYKSILCDEDSYLTVLVRYIHLNPVRAGIIKTLAELDHYQWSGHSAIVGVRINPWTDRAYILRQFSEREKSAKEAYSKYIEEGFAQGRIAELSGGGLVRSQGGWSKVMAMRRRQQREEYDERILGGGDFVNSILKETEARQMRQLKFRNAGLTIDKILNEECLKNKISIAELRSGSRRANVSRVRSLIAFRCREELGASAAEIARHTGVNTSSIIRAIARLEPGVMHSEKQRPQR
ncbi:MAG: hypothetical protein A2314_03260 [Elusimicrobia bacterium RIFOXYB2_FULL_50_12]|nr:MAG: hypothetical protein A2314_03260 [Elusimicrobia bacterium RIFOXYB2_FULL_50_12]